jgi:hypothetical protein
MSLKALPFAKVDFTIKELGLPSVSPKGGIITKSLAFCKGEFYYKRTRITFGEPFLGNYH